MTNDEILDKAKTIAMNTITFDYGNLSVNEAYELLSKYDADGLRKSGWRVWSAFENYATDAISNIVDDMIGDITKSFGKTIYEMSNRELLEHERRETSSDLASELADRLDESLKTIELLLNERKTLTDDKVIKHTGKDAYIHVYTVERLIK